jgi:hypothetical protein
VQTCFCYEHKHADMVLLWLSRQFGYSGTGMYRPFCSAGFQHVSTVTAVRASVRVALLHDLLAVCAMYRMVLTVCSQP